ncbi:MAG: bifunctional 4-hydroxy-2-oxoglutarate aldolase/2-dehydro-3-deoxy-phosphogluconate aldolase [Drouetiella hepatica Uher 2000/2452]|jgi:2-dehydro-3-deoxyphosphogluconate aldolase/(4S)-4-hydroxy-2-oxoglutarate aldolase|uniref:Bifunctional 4-hydroxy-2-oxoglutarate aldolase/2-dehydro-3-deoxy-phosphogluconate aldolase n=1 Tax=Drouetiella hepatica Uher 2000/2452 TaxID=904376 RepID=A0A951UP50_9CYAN|nr:bifunctional 4-hydroxy-2-oxoglutarate aldolase/2-dehydro-3-deoxy-phosphogluconate aldolase [Drouetiella hepatica Uher 2000/2452]
MTPPIVSPSASIIHSPDSWLSAVRSQRVIAVIRSPNLELGVQMAQSMAAAGLRLIEITWDSDRPVELITTLRAILPHCWIGAGTLLTLTDLQTAIAAGAQFLFSPHLNLALVEAAVSQYVPIVPGALTPSEIVAAWQSGATCVKVFPVQSMGGADYIRHLRSPLGQIPLIPTGGVTLANAPEFLQAGAIAVGLSSQLFPREAIVTGKWAEITSRAAGLLQSLQADPLA